MRKALGVAVLGVVLAGGSTAVIVEHDRSMAAGPAIVEHDRSMAFEPTYVEHDRSLAYIPSIEHDRN